MARKKSKEPPEAYVDPPEDELDPEPYVNEDYPDLIWDGGYEANVIRYDPADDVLRQIAAGKTPEGQRLTRDQMMGLAARVVGSE